MPGAGRRSAGGCIDLSWLSQRPYWFAWGEGRTGRGQRDGRPARQSRLPTANVGWKALPFEWKTSCQIGSDTETSATFRLLSALAVDPVVPITNSADSLSMEQLCRLDGSTWLQGIKTSICGDRLVQVQAPGQARYLPGRLPGSSTDLITVEEDTYNSSLPAAAVWSMWNVRHSTACDSAWMCYISGNCLCTLLVSVEITKKKTPSVYLRCVWMLWWSLCRFVFTRSRFWHFCDVLPALQ